MSYADDVRSKHIRRVPERMRRLKRLRKMRAPRWVIKSEQVALVLNKAGMKHCGLNQRGSKRQQELYAKRVELVGRRCMLHGATKLEAIYELDPRKHVRGLYEGVDQNER